MTPEERLLNAIMTDGESEKRREEIIAALQEEGKFLDIAKDYRSLSASEFMKKYWNDLHVDDTIDINYDFLENLDAGIETLDWIR